MTVGEARSQDDMRSGSSMPPRPVLRMSDEWREYFLALLHRDPRFASGRRYLRSDVVSVLRRLVPADTRVLEVGVAAGHVLASLPNAVRHGIDLLPEAVAMARRLDPAMRIEVGDILEWSSP